MDVDTACSLPPTRERDILMLGAKHSHVLVFTVPTKVQEGLHNPNRLPGRALLSLSSGHERQADGVCADEGQSRAYSGHRAPRAMAVICVTAAFPAGTGLSRHCQPLLSHCSLRPEQKRQMKARKRNRGTGESSSLPGVRRESVGRCGARPGAAGARDGAAAAQGLLKEGLRWGRVQLPKGHSHRHRGGDESRRLQRLAGQDERVQRPEEQREQR